MEEKNESKNVINTPNENEEEPKNVQSLKRHNSFPYEIEKDDPIKNKEKVKKKLKNLNFDAIFEEKESENDDLHSSKFQLFDDNETECGNVLEKINPKEDLIDSDDNEDEKNDTDIVDDESNINDENDDTEILTCVNCKKKFRKNKKINIFETCSKCSYLELQEIMLELYELYLKNVSHESKRYSVQVTNFFDRILAKTKIKNEISISDAIYLYGFKKYKLFAKIKNHICLICQKDTTKDYYYKLTCRCRLCSEKCFEKYLYLLIEKNFNKIIKNNFKKVNFIFEECICGIENYYDDYVTLYDFLKSKNNKKYCGMIAKIIKNRWIWRCVRCDQVFDPSNLNSRITIIDNKIKKDFYVKELTHFICSECADYLKRRSENRVFCGFCKSEHVIINAKKLGFDNKVKDNCVIY